VDEVDIGVALRERERVIGPAVNREGPADVPGFEIGGRPRLMLGTSAGVEVLASCDACGVGGMRLTAGAGNTGAVTPSERGGSGAGMVVSGKAASCGIADETGTIDD
jgi:hypothetical protein